MTAKNTSAGLAGLLVAMFLVSLSGCDLIKRWTASGSLKHRWSFKAERRILFPAQFGQGRAFVVSEDNTVYALNPADGKLLWKFSAVEKPVIMQTMKVVGDLVYVNYHGGNHYGLDAATGQVRWKAQLEQDTFSEPHAVNGKLYIGGTLFVPGVGRPLDLTKHAKVFIVDVKTGALEQTFTSENTLLHTPLVDGTMLYLGGVYYNLKPVDEGGHFKATAIDMANGFKTVWTHVSEIGMIKNLTVNNGILNFIGYQDDIYGLDAKTGQQVYATYTGNWTNGFVYQNDALYYGVGNNKVEAIHQKTGKLKWRHMVRKGGQFNTPAGLPVAANDTVYWVTVTDAVFQVVSASNGELIWEQKLTELGTAGPVQPAMDGKWLIVPAQNGVVHGYEVR